MMSSVPPSSRIRRIVLVVVLAIFASVIFVAAQKSENNLSSDPVAATPLDAAARTRIAGDFGKLPLSFELNKGQIDQRVKFLSRGTGYDLFLTATEAVLKVEKPRAAQQADKLKTPTGVNTDPDANVREGSVLRLKMLGANATPEVEGQDELPGKVNYFIGNDPAKWQRNIPTYRKVHFKDVYPGIDMLYYGKRHELEYDFVVAAGANPKLIRFTVEGAEKLNLDKSGKLLLKLNFGDVTLNKPMIYQLDENGSRREVKGTYVINGNEVRFKLERFDASKSLIIDPVLSYSTLLGSSSNDTGTGIAVDSQGNAYVTGTTDFNNFPTTAGSFKPTTIQGGAFVSKLDPTGSTLVYSTYIAGTINSGFNSTNGLAIAVDSSGNAHITGSTRAPDFPIVNGIKTTSNFFKTTDAAANWNNQNAGLVGEVNTFAVSSNGANTIYVSTTDGLYRSTNGGAAFTKIVPTNLASPFATALAVDQNNAAVVYLGNFSGLFKSTDSGNNWVQVTLPNFASVNCIVFDPATPATMYLGSSNGVLKSTDSGTTWIAQNNFNVSGTPNVRVLAIDPTTPLTIYAGTAFSGFFKSTNGGGVWTAMNTGMGGPSPTNINAIAIDPANTATIYTGHGSGGINKSTNGAASWTPLTNGVSQVQAVNAMVATSGAVYAAIANTGVIKTTNGGDNWTNANAGLWNSNVRFLIRHPSDQSTLYAGTTASFFNDAFVTKLNSTGSGLLFSTLLGGSNEEIGNGIAVDGNGNILVAGQTTSANFPTVNAVQSAPAIADNCNNGFVTKLNPSVPSYAFSTYLRGSQCDTANAVAVDTSGNVYVTGMTASTDFLTGNAFQPALAGPGQFNSDAFVTKLTTDGALTYSTYLGGASGSETGFGITADASGNAYVTGFTNSTNFPTQNPIQGSSGGNFASDVFVTKLNSQGSALVFSTYLGGSGSDTGRGIAIDSANNVYVTGTSGSIDYPLVVGALRTHSSMFKSIDGAANWTNDNFGFTSTSTNGLVIDPVATSTIYAGTQNGVFKSINGGRTWSPVNNGLNNLNVNSIAIDPSAPSTLYVSTSGFGGSSGIYKTTNGGGNWSLRNTGLTSTDVFGLVIDPVTPNTLYVAVNFCCVAGSHVFKTTDGADNWSPVANAPALSPAYLAVDPLNHLTIYLADGVNTGGIYKTTDGGATWTGPSFSQTGGFGRSVSVSPVVPGLVYADAGNGLFKSADGGATWTLIPSRSGKIVFDPVNPTTVYLLSPNFNNNPGLFKSIDNGQTWTAVNKGLNNPQATALAIDPVRPSTLYLASPITFGGNDAFVTKINSAGSALVYSTFIGGPANANDFSGLNAQAFGIAVDSSGNAYVAGLTSSQAFPVTDGAFQPFNRGSNDVFIAKLGMSFNISGQVLNGVTPLGGVEVVLNDGGSLTTVFTESDGSYQFLRLREGGSYTVSAAIPHFTMTPASQTFNNLNSDQVLNFNAATSNASFFTISGKVSENGTGLNGVKVTLSGSQSGVRTTDSNGNYSFELIAGGNYTITPATVGFTFAPENQPFNNLSANQTANFTANRQSFVVTNANNHGTGSLRNAIINANATPGTDTITFNIPGPGVKTINLLIALPDITERVIIDATTQPGYAGAPLIELDGAQTNSGSGLIIKAGSSVVRGLSIGNFRDAGISLNGCDSNVIQGNYIGVDADGVTARSNSRGIGLTNSANNLIGGTTAAARNVISGNSFSGIEFPFGGIGTGNIVQGNFIGTNAAGTAAPTNPNNPNGVVSQSQGVSISSSQISDNLIGGAVAGAGNLISGNQNGIIANGNNTTIQGNLIGTDATGTIKVPNTSSGIQAFATNILVGGLTPAARNIISGNSGDGVSIRGAGTKVQGNYIGTDISGTLALGNGGNGVSASEGTVVGGTDPGARNIISGNGGNFGVGNVGLGVNFGGSGATVQGNYIGTDVSGTRALSTTSPGIRISNSNNQIGGTAAGARNVISGNSIGIQLGQFSSGIVGNIIQGNFIGLNAAGTGAVPNTQQGIAITEVANSIIGGTANEAGNKIAFNGGPGITASGGVGNTIRGNSIFSNNGLGIDLLANGATGVTPNDVNDSDGGPNNLQNFPVITTVLSSANSTTIQGTLKSIPLTTFNVDFYSNAAVDPSGNGEGAQFFNTTAVSTDANGNATINVTFPAGLPNGRVITATATDPNGNTSEFSAADSTNAAGSVQFTLSSIQVIEDIGALTVTVQRTGGSSGTLTVDYGTTDGSAKAGLDYTSTAGTLSFSGGETSKTFQIPILDDATTETDENFTVELRNASTLESLGSPTTMIVTVQDRTTTPTVFINSASANEGNTGSTTNASFTVQLSAATGRAVSGNFSMNNLSAFGGNSCSVDGVDYVNTPGTFSFQPGTTTFTIPVTICGDTSAEANETFRVLLSNLTGAQFLSNQGIGTIVDDDVLNMLLEESGPIAGQAAALDAVLLTRDPFHPVMPDWFSAVPPSTRVMVFGQNLKLNPNELPSAVFVRFLINNNILLETPAEDVRPLNGSAFTQVVFRLPNLTPGTYTIMIRAHSRLSNAGTIRIVP